MAPANSTPTCWGDASRIHVGQNCNLVNTLFNTTAGEIHIGDYTFFGHNCQVLTGTHDVYKRNRERQMHPTSGRDIYIGEGVWIASGAIVLGPCTICDHVVIAAGSVVLPGTYGCGPMGSGSMYAGNPAKFVKACV